MLIIGVDDSKRRSSLIWVGGGKAVFNVKVEIGQITRKWFESIHTGKELWEELAGRGQTQ